MCVCWGEGRCGFLAVNVVRTQLFSGVFQEVSGGGGGSSLHETDSVGRGPPAPLRHRPQVRIPHPHTLQISPRFWLHDWLFLSTYPIGHRSPSNTCMHCKLRASFLFCAFPIIHRSLIVVVVVVNSFYMALFSAPEHSQRSHVILHE